MSDYSEEDYEWEKENGRCRHCGNLVDECTCDDDFIPWDKTERDE